LLGAINELTALHFVDGSTSMLVAANGEQWRGAVAPWLVVGANTPASLAAREIATLATLVPLADVVLSSDDDELLAHAQLVYALLHDDPATMTTSVGTLTEAYNRPLPSVAPRLWLCDALPSNEPARFVLAPFYTESSEILSSALAFS
jgi:hypothetical protein